MAKKPEEEYDLLTLLPSKPEFSEIIAKISGDLEEAISEDHPIYEMIADKDSESPFEEIVSLFLSVMKSIGSEKCLNICLIIACIATEFNPDNYETMFSKTSDDSGDERSHESREIRSSTIHGAFACMSNDIYKRVCSEYDFDKLAVIYCIKLFSNWLYRFDFSVANVDLNRFVNDTSV